MRATAVGRRKDDPKHPAEVISGTISARPMNVTPERARSHETFATRNCVNCNSELPEHDDSVACRHCGKESRVELCPHLARKPSWRITRWEKTEVRHAKRHADVVAVTVGDVTVYQGRFRDSLELRAEDGTRLPFTHVRAIQPGSEIVERMTHLGGCWRCEVAFFLPDCEIHSSGPPIILKVPLSRPTRHYMKPHPDPAMVVTRYREHVAEEHDE